jgi:hypothetical protein
MISVDDSIYKKYIFIEETRLEKTVTKNVLAHEYEICEHLQDGAHSKICYPSRPYLKLRLSTGCWSRGRAVTLGERGFPSQVSGVVSSDQIFDSKIVLAHTTSYNFLSHRNAALLSCFKQGARLALDSERRFD